MNQNSPAFVVWHVMHGHDERAWELLQELPVAELDALEDALDKLQDLIDARHAATTLLKLHGGGWDE